VLSNDTDEDGDLLSATLVSGPAHGTLTLNADGAFTYAPAASYAGTDSFTYKVNDGELVSNVATVSITVSQTNNFAGFFEPVDNPGPGPRYVFNSVKAGSAVPVKFSLAGDQSLDIFSPGYPTSRPVKCATAARIDPIEQTVTAGNSSLSYDPASDTYTYVWKTDKGWAGTCRVLTVQLNDGTQHLAYFRFK
jgi:VCBS repeat-containing protein